MITTFKNNSFFLIPYLIFVICGAVFISIHTRGETHLIINSFHTSFLDAIFPYVTWLGDGMVAAAVTFLLLFIRFRYAFVTGISFFLITLITQISRQTIFHGMLRPIKYFEGVHELHLVPGVTMYGINTFPSGHSTTAFALYFSLCLVVKNNFLKLVFFMLALLVAYSRVYLSEHFFADVYFSSMIGVFSAWIAYHFVWKTKKDWLDRSLLNIFKKP